ncbi:MAG: hypothetical protein QOH32_34 [Bradyrhizobium sp.]|jgi:hypothetical protein|nr:hypothetical protein [Bradyrhizobium sp.]
MPISVNSIFPVIAAQAAAPELVLQPGAVIDAQVMKILANDLVRIAIANLSIEVFSEIPLQVGQTLQLAVSQTPDGIRLAVVGQGSAAANAAALASPGREEMLSNAVSPDIVDLAAVAAEKPAANEVPLKNVLTPAHALAVAVTVQTAATRQNSLVPLFANLDALERSELLPLQLQQAVTQMLALRPKLDQNLGAGDIKNAFQNSGLFLESSLASGLASPSSTGVPDLKAALLVLRQTLQLLGEAIGEDAASPAAALPPHLARQLQATTRIPVEPASQPVAGSPALAPSLMPEIEVEEVFLPQARLPVAEDSLESNSGNHIHITEPLQHASGSRAATLNVLQEALQRIPQATARADQSRPNQDLQPDPLVPPDVPQRPVPGDAAAAAHTNVPPPPFRGALPSAQPALPPSIAADAPLAAIVHRLADDTDAAIARQTLLQVASLPDRADVAGPRTDPAGPRWNFEIPFSTAAGTAIAQFEIARDGGAATVDAAKPVWRARFSLDVEPAGPVHSLISLTGGRTSVRIWAERPATAAQLRAGVPRLSQALISAELQPGDIVVRHGAPTQRWPAPAGYFLDRAL